MDNVQGILSDDVVSEPLALLRHVNLTEVARHFLEQVAGAGTSSIFESVVLERNEPDKRHQICYYYVWPHQVEHSGATLNVVEQRGHGEKDNACTRQQIPL